MITTNKTIHHSQVLVNLSSLTVLPQQPPKHALPPHPLHLRRHTSLGGTLPLSVSSVTALALRSMEITGSCTRVDSGGLNDNTAILDELFDVGTGVGVANLSLLGGVEPDLPFPDASDGGREPLLRPKINHI